MERSRFEASLKDTREAINRNGTMILIKKQTATKAVLLNSYTAWNVASPEIKKKNVMLRPAAPGPVPQWGRPPVDSENHLLGQ